MSDFFAGKRRGDELRAIDKSLCKSSLAKVAPADLPGDQAASGASAKLVSSLNDWIHAAHFYRHEQGKADTIAQPPLGLAIYLVSGGAAHLRWLAELDLQRRRAPSP